jgi:hypothetical protein
MLSVGIDVCKVPQVDILRRRSALEKPECL